MKGVEQSMRTQTRTPTPDLSSDDLKRIVQSDAPADAQFMVQSAESLGDALNSSGLKSSQIRGIFSSVRIIETGWPVGDNQSTDARRAMRELILLKAKMAYQGYRTPEVVPLAKVLTDSIDFVGEDRDNFQRFVDFFEAILAYHKAAGGKD